MIERGSNFTKIDHRASSVGVSLPKRWSEIQPAPTKYPEPHVVRPARLFAVLILIYACSAALALGAVARWLA
jgi:hypothetical protein